MTGFYTALGIMAALNERHATGKGRVVETSMFEAMCHFNLDDFTHLLSQGEVMGPYSRPHVSQSYVFECADGQWIALHMSSPPKFWENLATAVGQPDMLQQPAFESREARIAHYDDVIAFLAPIFRERPRAHWEAELIRLEVPNSPVRTSREVLDSGQAQHLAIEVRDPDGPHGEFRTIRSPLSFDGERMDSVTAPPVLGEGDEEICGRRRA
jgi:crotonobetainyl-CoA:carnitine CoA-transferase CaiB-like acyl-CoA transferase